MWESIHLLCQNKGDGNHDNGNAEATMGWGVGGTQTVKRDHAKFCSEVAQLKMRDLMITKEEGGKAIFLIEDFYWFCLFCFIS